MIGVSGPDLYWLRLGPVELSPLLQAHIHVHIGLQDRLRVVYIGHEYLRRPNPKARWQLGETVRIPLDLALRSQITTLVSYALWTLLCSNLTVESLGDLQLQAAEREQWPAAAMLPPAPATAMAGQEDSGELETEV